MRGARSGRNKKKRFIKEYKDICGYAYIHYLDFGDNFMAIYVCQIVKMYTLNMCNILYVD